MVARSRPDKLDRLELLAGFQARQVLKALKAQFQVHPFRPQLWAGDFPVCQGSRAYLVSPVKLVNTARLLRKVPRHHHTAVLLARSRPARR